MIFTKNSRRRHCSFITIMVQSTQHTTYKTVRTQKHTHTHIFSLCGKSLCKQKHLQSVWNSLKVKQYLSSTSDLSHPSSLSVVESHPTYHRLVQPVLAARQLHTHTQIQGPLMLNYCPSEKKFFKIAVGLFRA